MTLLEAAEKLRHFADRTTKPELAPGLKLAATFCEWQHQVELEAWRQECADAEQEFLAAIEEMRQTPEPSDAELFREWDDRR